MTEKDVPSRLRGDSEETFLGKFVTLPRKAEIFAARAGDLLNQQKFIKRIVFATTIILLGGTMNLVADQGVEPINAEGKDDTATATSTIMVPDTLATQIADIRATATALADRIAKEKELAGLRTQIALLSTPTLTPVPTVQPGSGIEITVVVPQPDTTSETNTTAVSGSNQNQTTVDVDVNIDIDVPTTKPEDKPAPVDTSVPSNTPTATMTPTPTADKAATAAARATIDEASARYRAELQASATTKAESSMTPTAILTPTPFVVVLKEEKGWSTNWWYALVGGAVGLGLGLASATREFVVERIHPHHH